MTKAELKTHTIQCLLDIADEELDENRLQDVLDSDVELNRIVSELCEQKEFNLRYNKYEIINSKIAFDKFIKIVK